MIYEKVEVKDICKIKSGKRLPKGADFANEITNYPYIRARDIKNGIIDGSELVYLTEEVQKKIQKYIVNTNDIVITIVGASVGDVGFVKSEFDGFNLTENAVRLTDFDERVNPRFLLYILNSKKYWELMQQIAGGSAQPKLGIYKIESIPLELPPVEVQNKIINILSDFDDLIENNKTQIKLLEEAAQRLYKEWFIDLRFPDHEDVAIVDGVPEGWKKERIGDLIGKVIRSKQVKTAEYLNKGAIPVIDQSRDFIAGYTNDPETIVDIGCPIIVFGDHTRILKYIQFPFAKGADGTQLIVSANENMPQSLLYCSLIAVDLSNYHYARHFKYLKEESILVPSKEIADEFDRYVTPMLLQVQQLRNIADKAAESRDRLLPKLMSGEIEV